MKNSIKTLTTSEIHFVSGAGGHHHLSITTSSPERFKRFKIKTLFGLFLVRYGSYIQTYNDALSYEYSSEFKEDKITIYNKEGSLVSEKVM